MNKAVHPQQARPALRLLCILTPPADGQWHPVPAATHRPREPRADIRGRWGYVLPEELYMREVWIRAWVAGRSSAHPAQISPLPVDSLSSRERL